jgi:5-methylcytosine-specific restriction endonuclease McrBC regulatory subunit McrC
MEKWLNDILKDNTLVDNQNYSIDDGVFKNHRLERSIILKNKKKGQKNRVENNNNELWKFLNTVNRDIGKVLAENREKAIVLFNDKEYEHNTDDEFIQIQGIDSRNFTLKTGNLIGYIKYGDYELKISSRFGDLFLREIIADADGFLELSDLEGSRNSNGYEWLLIYLWKIKLKKAFRLGLPKVYKSHVDTLTKVKGNIDIVDYTLNSQKGRYRCNYREHSYDNIQARLIEAAISKVKGHSFSGDLQAMERAFKTAINGKKSKLRDFMKVPYFSNPFYSEYNAVIDLSLLLLKEELSDFGEKSNTNAFLFDISMLFEYYIRKILIKNGFFLYGKFSKNKKITTGSFSSYKRKLEPDLVLDCNGKLIILDVKYKVYDFNFGVSREDIFQIHTYVGQYGNSEEVICCGFVYPLSADMNLLKVLII